MAKIAVVHVPYFSHINALTRLTGVLVRQGHEVVAWAPEPSRARIEAAGARHVFHHPEMPDVNGFEGWVAVLTERTEEFAKTLVEELFAEDMDLVVHDSQVPWARVAADYLGLPRIVSHPMFPIVSPHSIKSRTDWEREAIHPEDATGRFEASWLNIALRWGVELGDWDQVIHSAHLSETTFAYTTRTILGEWDLSDAWKLAGPLMEPPPPRAPRGERPLVYACFGTSFNDRPEQFAMVIEGFAGEPVDVLVSTGLGSITADDLGPLPPNVALREFVPAREVLARADVHLTHGGNNSVHECLLAGVPMLVMPQAFDQFPLSYRIEELGAGCGVDEDPEAVRRGLRWLLEDPIPTQRARELGDHLSDFDGEAVVAEVVEQVLADESVSA